MNFVAFHPSPERQFRGKAWDVFGFHPESGNSSLLPEAVLSAFKICDLHRMSDQSIATCRKRFKACAATCQKKFDCLQVALNEASDIQDELVTDLSISADPAIHRHAAEAASLLS